MSGSALQTCPPTDSVMNPPLHSNPPSNQTQNQTQTQTQTRNPVGTGPMLVSGDTLRHHQRTLPSQASNPYSLYVPSVPSSSTIRTPYGPTPTSAYTTRGTVQSPALNSETNALPGQMFSHPSQNTSMPQYLSTTAPGSYAYNANSGNPISSPWNENLFHAPTQNNRVISSPNTAAPPLSYPPSQHMSGFHRPGQSGHLRPTQMEYLTPNVPAAPPINSIVANTHDIPSGHVHARRNLLPRNRCREDAQSAIRDSVNDSGNTHIAGVVSMNNDTANVIQSPLPPPPSSGGTRRRTRRTRSNAASPAANRRAQTAANGRKAPARPRAPRKKQEPKKIQPVTPNEQCSICLDVPQKTEVACINGCSHTFCFQCIEKWADRENTCPLCKMRFTKIDRVNKPPPKKRKKGDAPRAKNTKKVKNRDQRADISMVNPLQGLLASMNNEFPQAFTQLFLGPQIMTSRGTNSTRANRFLQSLTSSRSRSNNGDFSLDWINPQPTTNQPRRSARIENMGRRQRTDGNIRSNGSDTAGRSLLRGAAENFFPFAAIEQINPRVRNIIFERPNILLNNNGVYNEASDDDSDTEYDTLISHLNQPFEGLIRNERVGTGIGGHHNRHLDADPDFFARNSQFNSSNNDIRSNQVARSYALNLNGGDTADTALEIQDSDDEVEIADESDVEIEVLIE